MNGERRGVHGYPPATATQTNQLRSRSVGGADVHQGKSTMSFRPSAQHPLRVDGTRRSRSSARTAGGGDPGWRIRSKRSTTRRRHFDLTACRGRAATQRRRAPTCAWSREDAPSSFRRAGGARRNAIVTAPMTLDPARGDFVRCAACRGSAWVPCPQSVELLVAVEVARRCGFERRDRQVIGVEMSIRVDAARAAAQVADTAAGARDPAHTRRGPDIGKRSSTSTNSML